MRFIVVSAWKDLRRLRREPYLFAVWLGIPILLTLLFSLVFGRGQTAVHGRLLIADEDATLASRAIGAAFNQGPLGEMIRVENVKPADGRARLARGDGSAFLRVPKGFGDALLDGRAARLELVTNPAQRIMPGIIQETVGMLAEGAHYLQSIFGDQIRQSRDRSPTDVNVAETAVRINAAIRSLSSLLNPPAIVLETKMIEDNRPQFNFGAAMLPGMLMMTVFFLAGGFAAEMWKERLNGTLRRLAMTPARVDSYLAGKVLAQMLVVGAVGAAALAAGGWLMGLPLTHAPVALLWVVVSGSVLFLFVVLLQVHMSSERAANVASNLFMFPLLMIGGSFFPFEVMPEGMARIGRMTPNGWALGELRDLLSGAASAGAVWMAFAVALAAGALVFWIAARRVRRSFVY